MGPLLLPPLLLLLQLLPQQLQQPQQQPLPQLQLDAPTPALTLTSLSLAPAPASTFPQTQPPKLTPSRLVSPLVLYSPLSTMPRSKTTSPPSSAARTPGSD